MTKVVYKDAAFGKQIRKKFERGNNRKYHKSLKDSAEIIKDCLDLLNTSIVEEFFD